MADMPHHPSLPIGTIVCKLFEGRRSLNPIEFQSIDDCSFCFPDNPNDLLPLVLFFVLLSLVAAGLAMLMCFRSQRNHWRTRRRLLPNMEVPGINPIADPQLPSIRPFSDDGDFTQSSLESAQQPYHSDSGIVSTNLTTVPVNNMSNQSSHISSESIK